MDQSERLSLPLDDELEKYHIKPDEEYHGKGGPVEKTFPRWITDLHLPFIQTLEALGVPINLDPVRHDHDNRELLINNILA